MPKSAKPAADLTTIQAERARIEAMLADIVEREKQALETARDAGRAEIHAALEKVKIGAMLRAEAKVIAQAIARHGGGKVAQTLAALG